MDNDIPQILKGVTEKLDVIYPGSEKVTFGEELTPTQVKDQPVVKWTAKSNTFYTLLMIDLDAPCRKIAILSEVNHWLVVNIFESDLKSGETIAAYQGSGPPKYTGLHRYVFILYEQEKHINFDEKKVTAGELMGRIRFNTKNLAQKYNLGDPVSGNFFRAKWDEYVDIKNRDRKCVIL